MHTYLSPRGLRHGLVAVVLTAAAMASIAPAAVAAATGATGATAATADVIFHWNDVAFDTVRQTSGSDAAAARLYAMVDTSMYDAVNGLDAHPRPYALVPPAESRAGDPVAAAATAAHDVLVALYPARTATYDAQLERDLATVGSSGQAKHGRAWGSDVAAAVVAARSNDGSSGVEIQHGGSGAEQFRTDWDAHFRNLAPFAIAHPGDYVGPQPPRLDTPEYAAAFNDVKSVGSNAPDPQASATFNFWKLSGGTNQPPGAWLQIAESTSVQRGLSLEDTAQLFALESMALADTVGPTNETKFRYRYWRPETAIQEADPTVNPATVPDPTWKGRGSLSGTPEHFSGHSSFSGAGAEVLRLFFCMDDIAVTIATDSGVGASRTYPSFSAVAAEVGRSRVLGGQHFEFSNQDGLRAGRQIADEVVARAGRSCAA